MMFTIPEVFVDYPIAISVTHVLFSETNENNFFVIKCHANNQVIYNSDNCLFFFMHMKKCTHFAGCWILLEEFMPIRNTFVANICKTRLQSPKTTNASTSCLKSRTTPQ